MQSADIHTTQKGKIQAVIQGLFAALPLSIAVIPWGILAGSYAVDAGLTIVQSQAMSAIVFAGAAQLVSLGMIKAGIGIGSILLTTLLVTSRHFLYSMAMRKDISPLPLKWRLTLGFLLTDELFAICGQDKRHTFDPWYAFGGGFSFYLFWNIASAVGIFAGTAIPNLDQLGLDFAIAATFIALVVPVVKSPSIFVCVLVSLIVSLLCEIYDLPAALLISALTGMTLGYGYARVTGEKK